MQRSFIPSHVFTESSALLHQKLNSYALAATAAGVSLLAIAPPAAAEIIFTAANGHIANNQKLNLDLNHDGIPDFALINAPHFGPNGNSFGASFSVRPLGGNGIWASNNITYFAANLPAGVAVGPKAPFHSTQLGMAFAERTAENYFSGGGWKTATNRFLGLKILINGEVHFGWARLTVAADQHQEQVTATLTGYAYESEPDTPIVTGQISGGTKAPAHSDRSNSAPTTLGKLALGFAVFAAGQK